MNAHQDMFSPDPLKVAQSAVLSIESAMCCIDERLRPIFVAIHEMAKQLDLTDIEKSKRLGDIAKLANAGLGIADDMTSTLDAQLDARHVELNILGGEKNREDAA